MEARSKSKLLIVEGNDEVHVIEKLVKRHQLRQSFDIWEKGGFTELRKSIYNEVNVSQREALGILADANSSCKKRWQSISEKLREADCEVPANLAHAGSVFSGPRGIRVGVWLMPDNKRPGELEDFVAKLIPQNDPLWPRAQAYIDGIPAEERKFESRKLTRAHVHAWLAARKSPRRMGTAITAGDLRHDAPVATSLVGWLRELFGA
ncbi:MAG: hypothetical protein OXF72_03700 [Gammaproteobacteria bacterium]|nr:hypothetical protein [Gammaproteobacteria bacterium]